MVRLAPLAALLAAGCTKTTEQPNLAGQDVHLTAIHTSDIHSRVFPYQFSPGQIDKGLGLVPSRGNIAIVGGAARMATVMKREREASSRVIYVDSGDIFQGAPVFNMFSGEVEMRVMTQLGLTAMVLGNHEFDKGATNLALQKSRFGGFPMLAANYSFSDPNDYAQPKLRNVIPPYAVVNAGGLRIGIIGMANLSSLNSIVEGGNSLGVRPIETHQAMADAVRVLRPFVDLLTVVSHLGLDEDEGVVRSTLHADENEEAAIEGVDVVFGGHLHIVLNPPKDLPHVDDMGNPTGHTVLVHSGAFGKYVGRLDLVVHVGDPAAATEAEKKSFVKSYTYKIIPIDDSIPPDPDMSRMLEPYQLKLNTTLNLIQNYAVVPCATTQATCPKILRADPDGGDSQLGNLVATSMRLRRRVEADFALTNSLGIRADFESGPLNLEQMYNVFPFDNFISTMFLSGNEIREMLDFVAARSGERGCRSQVQVSGIWLLLDCAKGIACGPFDAQGKPATHCTRGGEWWRASLGETPVDGPPLLGDNCLKERLSPADTWKCRPVTTSGEYRVAVNDYIASGGSGFQVLKRNTTKFNTGISLRDSLIDFIRQIPGRCDRNANSNIVFDGPDITEPVRPCTAKGAPDVVDKECGGGHVCPTGQCFRHYDYSGLPCLDFNVQAHDGRILTGK